MAKAVMSARRSWVVCLVAAVLAACGDEAAPEAGQDDVVPEEAVSASALSGPGTELGNGLLVAEGSALIGAPVPLGTTGILDDEPIVDPGWEARLFVSGGPGPVIAEYLGQAEGLGFELTELASGQPFAMEGESAPEGYGLCAGVGGGSFECGAMAARSDGACLVLDLVRSRHASHLTLRLTLAPPFPCAGKSGVPGDLDGVPPPAPSRWADRPKVGERFGDAWGTLAPVEVQEGSGLVAAPVWRSGCGGPIAVLEVTDHPSDVLDRYTSAIERITIVPPQVSDDSATSGSSRLLRRWVVEPAGGRTFAMDLVTNESGPAWLFMHACDG